MTPMNSLFILPLYLYMYSLCTITIVSPALALCLFNNLAKKTNRRKYSTCTKNDCDEMYKLLICIAITLFNISTNLDILKYSINRQLAKNFNYSKENG